MRAGRIGTSFQIPIESCIPWARKSLTLRPSPRPALTAGLCHAVCLIACAPPTWASVLISSRLITARCNITLRAGRQGPALGKGPWRFSLDLLHDTAYMESTAALLDRFDTTHPVTAGSATLGTDYEELKALLREEAKRHMLARSRVRNAQVIAADRAVRDALTLYQRHPTLAYAREGLMLARARRQDMARTAAIAAARKAQVMWQHYGEQPTFWFHWLTRERQQLTTIDALRCGPTPDSPAVPLDGPPLPRRGSPV